jgi:hypothetical protein
MNEKKFFVCSFDSTKSSNFEIFSCFGYYTFAEAKIRCDISTRESIKNGSRFIYFVCSFSQLKNLPILPF